MEFLYSGFRFPIIIPFGNEITLMERNFFYVCENVSAGIESTNRQCRDVIGSDFPFSVGQVASCMSIKICCAQFSIASPPILEGISTPRKRISGHVLQIALIRLAGHRSV
jgi:hypothetical protein